MIILKKLSYILFFQLNDGALFGAKNICSYFPSIFFILEKASFNTALMGGKWVYLIGYEGVKT